MPLSLNMCIRVALMAVFAKEVEAGLDEDEDLMFEEDERSRPIFNIASLKSLSQLKIMGMTSRTTLLAMPSQIPSCFHIFPEMKSRPLIEVLNVHDLIRACLRVATVPRYS